MVAVVMVALLAGGTVPAPSPTSEVAARFAAALHAEADEGFAGSWRLATRTTVRDARGARLHTLERVSDVERNGHGRQERLVRAIEDGRDVTALGTRRPTSEAARRARRVALAARLPAPDALELSPPRTRGSLVEADFRPRPGARTEVVRGTLAWDAATHAPRWAELVLSSDRGLVGLRVRLEYAVGEGVAWVRHVHASARERRRLFARAFEVSLALSRIEPAAAASRMGGAVGS